MNFEAEFIDNVRFIRRAYYAITNQSRVKKKLVKVQEKLPDCFPLAIVNFSIDYELFWGNAFDHGTSMSEEKRIHQASIARSNSFSFYALLEEVKMNCTWSVVGKLMDPDKAPSLELQFSPPWSDINWYQKPDADITTYEAYEFIKLLATSPYLEILSHGFAHIDYADLSVTKQMASEDLKIAKELLHEFASTEKAFFYPCNKVKYEEVAYALGYRVTRGSDNHWHISKNELIKTPIGFWISPAMLSLNDAKRLVDIGIKNKSFIHPWMHLIELNMKADDLERFYRPLFLYIQAQEKAGNLEIITFGNIEKRISNMNDN
ncbi:MAG: hypothetical protein H7336_17425 [Bacteriovorax sp.]|nr:hypothetical protein [Bacteriovorax sp.]